MKKFLALGTALILCGCAREASLYQLNMTAGQPAQVLKAKFMSYGTGHGTIEITMPDGELLKGEYDVSLGGSSTFGSIYASAYGTGGYASGAASGSSINMENSSEGEAVLVGNKGTSMQCEFLNNNWTGRGHGACKSSKGDIFKVMY